MPPLVRLFCVLPKASMWQTVKDGQLFIINGALVQFDAPDGRRFLLTKEAIAGIEFGPGEEDEDGGDPEEHVPVPGPKSPLWDHVVIAPMPSEAM